MDLTRWPGELSATQNVKVKMEDRLASVFAVVDDHSVTVAQSTLFGAGAGNQKQFSKDLIMG